VPDELFNARLQETERHNRWIFASRAGASAVSPYDQVDSPCTVLTGRSRTPAARNGATSALIYLKVDSARSRMRRCATCRFDQQPSAHTPTPGLTRFSGHGWCAAGPATAGSSPLSPALPPPPTRDDHLRET
jgi:hypothetical protein